VVEGSGGFVYGSTMDLPISSWSGEDMWCADCGGGGEGRYAEGLRGAIHEAGVHKIVSPAVEA
jgi:hypothetical protein